MGTRWQAPCLCSKGSPGWPLLYGSHWCLWLQSGQCTSQLGVCTPHTAPGSPSACVCPENKDPAPYLATTTPSCAFTNQHFVCPNRCWSIIQPSVNLFRAGSAPHPSDTYHLALPSKKCNQIMPREHHMDFPFTQVICIKETQVLKIYGLALPSTHTSLEEGACTAACTFTDYFKGH